MPLKWARTFKANQWQARRWLRARAELGNGTGTRNLGIGVGMCSIKCGIVSSERWQLVDCSHSSIHTLRSKEKRQQNPQTETLKAAQKKKEEKKAREWVWECENFCATKRPKRATANMCVALEIGRKKPQKLQAPFVTEYKSLDKGFNWRGMGDSRCQGVYSLFAVAAWLGF